LGIRTLTTKADAEQQQRKLARRTARLETNEYALLLRIMGCSYKTCCESTEAAFNYLCVMAPLPPDSKADLAIPSFKKTVHALHERNFNNVQIAPASKMVTYTRMTKCLSSKAFEHPPHQGLRR